DTGPAARAVLGLRRHRVRRRRAQLQVARARERRRRRELGRRVVVGDVERDRHADAGAVAVTRRRVETQLMLGARRDRQIDVYRGARRAVVIVVGLDERDLLRVARVHLRTVGLAILEVADRGAAVRLVDDLVAGRNVGAI